MSDTIYRVTVVKFSDGRGVTGREVLYCGADRLVAQAAFHRSMVSDYDRDGGYRQYSGQIKQQDCYLELDCRDGGSLSCDYNSEIGNGIPMAVWHGHRIRFGIPALDAEAANELMEEIEPLAKVVIAGYESVWNGNNHVAKFDDGAESAKEQIEEITERYALDRRSWSYCQPCDWYNGHANVDGETTDEDIAEMAKEDEAIARAEYMKVPADEIVEYLTERRDECRAEATP